MAYVFAAIHEEDGTFGVSFPDFPGCITTAATIDDAIFRAEQVIDFHVEGMIEDGEEMPQLRSAARLRAEESEWMEGAILVLVPVDLPSKAQRVNITMDGNLLKRVDHAAQVAGQSRSGYIASAVSARIAGVK